MDHCSGQKGTLDTLPIVAYSHLFDKRGGGAKVAKSLNVEVEINVEGGIFWKKTST